MNKKVIFVNTSVGNRRNAFREDEELERLIEENRNSERQTEREIKKLDSYLLYF